MKFNKLNSLYMKNDRLELSYHGGQVKFTVTGRYYNSWCRKIVCREFPYRAGYGTVSFKLNRVIPV